MWISSSASLFCRMCIQVRDIQRKCDTSLRRIHGALVSEKERADRNFADFERVRAELGEARAVADGWMQAFYRLRTEFRRNVGRPPMTKGLGYETEDDENGTEEDEG